MTAWMLGFFKASFGSPQEITTKLGVGGCNIIKGLSTAEGGRGHVTTYMYRVTIKIQTLGPDIL